MALVIDGLIAVIGTVEVPMLAAGLKRNLIVNRSIEDCESVTSTLSVWEATLVIVPEEGDRLEMVGLPVSTVSVAGVVTPRLASV